MDKGEDDTGETMETPKPGPGQGKYFCNICSLDYPTESQFSEHKWSSLHHNQMEKSYGRGFIHRCLLCQFESHSIGEYSKHIFGDQHKDAFKKYKAKAKAARLAKQRAAHLAAKQAAKRKAAQKIHSHWKNRLEKPPKQRPVSSHARFRNAPHKQMERSEHYNPQLGNPFTKQNQLYTSFNQPMFRTQPVWQAGYSGNNDCYDRRDSQHWQYNQNTKWMDDGSRFNFQVPKSTQKIVFRPSIFTAPLGSNGNQNFVFRPSTFTAPLGSNSNKNVVVRPPLFTAPQGSTISPKTNIVTTLSGKAKCDNPINDKYSTSVEKASPEATLSVKAKSNAVNSTTYKDSTSVWKASLEATLSAKSAKAKSNAVHSTKHMDTTSLEKASTKATLSVKAKSNAVNSTKHMDSTSVWKASLEATLPAKSAKAKSNVVNSTKHMDTTSLEKASPEATLSVKAKSIAVNSTTYKDSTSVWKASLEATLPAKSAKAKSNVVNSTKHMDTTSLEKASPEATLSVKAKSNAVNSTKHMDSTSVWKASLEATLPAKSAKAKSNVVNSTKHMDTTSLEKASSEATLSVKAKSNAVNSTNYKDCTSSEKASTKATLLKKAACETSRLTKSSMDTKIVPKSISNVTANSDTAMFQRASTTASLSEKSQSNVSHSDIGIKDNTKLQRVSPNPAISKNLKSVLKSSTNGSKYTSVFQKATQNDTKTSESSGTDSTAITNSLTKKHEMHSRKKIEKADDSVSEGSIFRNSTSNAVGSSETNHNSKRDDIHEKQKVVTNTLVPKDVSNKDRSVNDVSCHLSSDLTKDSRPTDDINAEINIDSETSREPSLRDILIKHISKSLKPNVGASRSRLHAGIRTQIENTETTLQQKLVQILSLSKSKHTQETEIAKLKQISGPQKRFRKRYGLQLGSSDGQTDDIQENSENRLLENLSGCNFTDMKIHEDPELMTQLRAFAEGEQSSFSDDLSAIDINSGKTTTPSTSSASTGVCIKQEPIEPLENVQKVNKQVYDPTNISENLSSGMKEKRKSKTDKQKKTNNLPIDSKQCYQQNQLPVVSEDLPFVDINDINSGKTSTLSTSSTSTAVCIKQEPIEPLEDVVQDVNKQVYEPTNISENLSSGMKEKRKSKTDKQKKTNNLPIDSKQCYQQNQLQVVSEDLPFVDINDINSGKTSTLSTSSTSTAVCIKQEPIEPLEDVVQNVNKQVYEPTNISENLSSGMKEKSKRISKTGKQKKANNLPIDSKQYYQQNQLQVVSEDLPFVDINDINSGKTSTLSTSSTSTGVCIKQEPIEPLEDVVQNVTKQVYEPTNISENLSSGMKEKCKRISKAFSNEQKKTNSLPIDPRQCYQQNQMPVVSEDLNFVDVNSGKTATSSTSSTTIGVCIKQEPIEPLEDAIQKVEKQVHKPTNILKNQSSSKKVSDAISDKQKKSHNFAIDSSHSYQKNHIKKEPLADGKVASSNINTVLEASPELSVQTDASMKTENVSTNEFEILRENIYQQTHNIMLMEKSDLLEWKNRNNSCGTKVEQNRKIIANRKVENGQSTVTKEDASSKYSCKVQLERLDGSSFVKEPVTAIQEDRQLSAVSKGKEKTEDGDTRRKKDTQVFRNEVVSFGTSVKCSQISPAPAVELVLSGSKGRHATSDPSLVRCSQSSPAPIEVVPFCAAEKLYTLDQTSAERSQISPTPAQTIQSSGEASASGMHSDLEKLFNISVREESLHQKMKEMEENIQELKDVILKKQMALNNVQSAKQQLDRELQSLRGMRMNILEGARGRGEDMSSLPEVEKVSNRKRQYAADVFRYSLAHDEPEMVKEDAIDEDKDSTFNESQIKKSYSTRIEQKKDNPESQLVRTDASGSDADTTPYPPAIVLSTGNQNIDMQSVISVLSNPHILQQIQFNFNQLNQMPTEPEKEALIVTIPESESVPDAAPEDHAMKKDPVEEKVPDNEALIVDVPKSESLLHFPPDSHAIKEDSLEEKETRKLRKKRKLPSGREDNLEVPMTRNSKRIKNMRNSKILTKKTLMETPECCTEATSKKKSCDTPANDPKGHTHLSKKRSETQANQTVNRVGKRKSSNLSGKDSEEPFSEESSNKVPGTSETSQKKSCDTPAIDPKGHTHLSKKPSETQANQTFKQVGKRKSGNLSGKDSEETFSEESSDKEPGTSRKLRVKPSPIEYPAKKRSSKVPKKKAENSAQLDTKESSKKLRKNSKKKERSSAKTYKQKRKLGCNKKLWKDPDKQGRDMMDESNLRFINCEEELLSMEVMEGNLYCVCKDNSVRAYSLQSCQLKGTFTASNADVLCIAFVKKTLFVSYADQKLCEFDLETHKCIYEYHCSSDVICMHSNWDTLYIGMLNGIIAVVNSKKRELTTKHTVDKDYPPVNYITSTVRHVAKVLIVASRIISIIDEKTGSLIAILNINVKVDVIYMNVIGDTLYTADSGGFLFVNNVNDRERICCTCLDSSLTSFQITDEYIITASEQRSVFKFVDKETFKVQLQYTVNGKTLRCALVHQKTLIIGGKHGLICLYDPWDHFWSTEYAFYPKRLKAYGKVRNAIKKRKFLLQTV